MPIRLKSGVRQMVQITMQLFQGKESTVVPIMLCGVVLMMIIPSDRNDKEWIRLIEVVVWLRSLIVEVIPFLLTALEFMIF